MKKTLRRHDTAPAFLAALGLAGLLFGAPTRVGAQEHAHQHGVVQVDASLDGNALVLALSAPLDNLLGFERAPRSAAEKKAAQDVSERLRKAGAVFAPDPAAQCTPVGVELESAALGLGSAAPEADGHAELDASYRFDCRSPALLAFVDLPLVAAFPRIGRVEAQIVGAKGQAKQVLKRPAARLAWPR